MSKFGIIGAVMLVVGSTSASAGSYQGKVTSVFAVGGKVFIHVGGGLFDNANTCTGSTTGLSLWIDPATDYGKTLISLALVAKTTEKTVWASGNNTCISGPIRGQSEQLSALDLKG